MKITSVSIGLRRTESLPGYSNVAPSINLTAEVEEGEEWLDVRDYLMSVVKLHVEKEIDDALEDAGQPPKYYQGMRFTLLRWNNLDLYVIVPDEEIQLDDIPGDWRIYGNLYDKDAPVYRHQRLEVLREMATAADIDAVEIPWSKYDNLVEWAWAQIADMWTALDVDTDSGVYSAYLGPVIVPCSVWRESILCHDDLRLRILSGTPIGTREDLETWAAHQGLYRHTPSFLETNEQLDEWVGERLAAEREETPC